jgi:flagellar motor protein MotB
MEKQNATFGRLLTGGNNTTIIQFLSLYLLVLAFFILLVTISTFEKVKSSAVMDSLNSTFATVLPPSTELTSFNAKSGPILAGQAFQEKTSKLFATTLGVEKIEVIQPGRTMRVQMTADSLFETGKAVIREAQRPMIDRLITSLSSRPPGFQFDMEFVIGSAYATGTNLPIGQTLEMSRAGAFVREMLGRGVPPDAISIGMRHADQGQVVMWFYVRSPEEAQKFYSRLIAPPEKSPEGSNESPSSDPVKGKAPTGSIPARPARELFPNSGPKSTPNSGEEGGGDG